MHRARACAGITMLAMYPLAEARAQQPAAPPPQDTLVTSRGDSVMVRLADVDLRAAVQALSRYMDRPVVINGVIGGRVTLETPRPVPRARVPQLLRGLLDGQNIELVLDSANAMYKLRPREVARPAAGVAVTNGAPAPAPPSGPQPLQLFVIRLRHAKAGDVAATVNALYGKGGAVGELGDRRRPTLNESLAQDQIAPAGSSMAGQVVASVAGRNASLSGDITIVPDSRANSLLVRASRADFALIQAAVTELDVRPLQVLIEVVIAELRRDRSFDFGIDLSLPETGVRGSRTDGRVKGAINGGGPTDFVLQVMSLGGSHIDATLRAAASRGDVNILSRPVLLAANNEHAEINVGSQRPFVQVSRVLPTDNTARDQVVQYKDVGTKLQIIPTISADGFVMLQVTQEINAATTEQQFNAPVISTRSVETKLLVKDGQTIVLGGLSDSQREVSQSGVPFLSAIPLIGGLFGRSHRSRIETELYLFLTPRVIRRDEDVEQTTEGYRGRAGEKTP